MSKNRNEFQILLVDLINKSLKNYYVDNHDERRFGLDNESVFSKKINQLKQKLFRNHLNIGFVKTLNNNMSQIMTEYGSLLNQVYNLFEDEESKKLYVELIAFRVLGKKKVKLKTHRTYHKNLIIAETLFNLDEFTEVNWLGKKRKLYLANLNEIGFDIKLFIGNIECTFLNRQYEYNSRTKVEPGDIVMDCGVCYGDTPLYFASLAGKNGKVFGFEFIPSNLLTIKKNLKLNPELKERIELIERPLWNKENMDVYYKDMGPGSKVELEKFKDFNGNCKTITIDTVVKDKKLEKVNFIKMDIEGAEPLALEGALNTIKKFKPKLAISIYHSLNDYVNIALWINSLNLGYKFYLGHATIHSEETILFAEPKKI